ncbi:hypothetical protein [Marinagarivorans algicola]|uniref:hypothetical protein n=1 Tax=Marinagarivorans algicola TaxID=1513270 RepID=UPI0006B8A295|nr:hypothetical protein [Marinagarivorans algicola]
MAILVWINRESFFASLRLVGLGLVVALCLIACGGGGGAIDQQETSFESLSSASLSASPDVGNDSAEASSESVEDTTSSPSSEGGLDLVVLKGTLTYGWVAPVAAQATQNHGTVFLDYDNVQARPMRRVTVQLLDSLNQVVAETRSDEQGGYRFTIDADRAIKVRVKAELESDDYLVSVKDNTQGNAQYVLDGSLASTGNNAVQTRDIHAPLGWDAGAQQYTSDRVSAPFTLLDTLLESIDMVLDAGPELVLPPLTVYWSVKNIATGGDFEQGHIGSSLYSTGRTAMYILGHADNDTDEFDRAVIQHEFGHYIEDKLSRSESIGGAHFLGVPIDMRVAFGEGFGNAFAAMSSGDPLYLDTSTTAQQNGFGFSVETNRFGGGYYSESAVQAVLFDIFDDTTEAGDNLHLGFAPILEALRHPDYISFDGFTSIYAFATVLKSLTPTHTEEIASLLSGQDIVGVGFYGEGERYDGGSPISLPVYQTVSVNETVEVCSDNQVQEYNGHDVNRYVLVSIPSAGMYTLTAQRSRGIPASDPDFQLYRNGIWAGRSESSDLDRETWSKLFQAGVYALVVQEAGNTDESDATGGLVCFDVSLTQ